MSHKRKLSVLDLTTNSPPLPAPLTTRPLGPRSESPASSVSSRSVCNAKRRKRVPQVNSSSQETTGQETGLSNSPHSVIDVDSDVQTWHGVDTVKLDRAAQCQERNAVAGPSKLSTTGITSPSHKRHSSPPSSNLLSTHTCPICFSTITNACLTPCGHVLCGACLFAAVKSGIQRSLSMNIPVGAEGTTARCPVCRAVLKGWDGKGGGIIPLKFRTIVAL